MATISKHANVDGQPELFPHTVDRLAATSPDAVFGQWPIEQTSYEAGFRTITYAQLANMVNGLAWWIVEQIGPGQSCEPLAYVGPNDVRTSALVLATVKAGYALFLTSPRNSAAAHQALFDRLKCRVLLTPEPTPPQALSIIETVSPQHLKVPSIDDLMKTEHRPYEYTKTYEQGRNDPLWIIHTSGSTGIPKPMVWTQEAVLRHQAGAAQPAPDDAWSIESFSLGARVMVTLPPFHGAGLGQFFLYGTRFGNISIAPAAATIVSAEGLVESLKQTPADVALLVPSVVAELAQKPALLDYCAKHLKLLVYLGGNLPKALGDTIAAKIPLRCQWGASEAGMPQQLMSKDLDPRTDWRYTRFHPAAGVVFEEVSSGIYEMVIRRNSDPTLNTQATFAIGGVEGPEEYHTRDLFTPHPTVPDTWAWAARADDIIVFLNGEKTNPISMEQHIMASNPELAGVIVIGSQRFQAALLIEPFDSDLTTTQQAALIERVWPSVEEANREAPAHARVEKSLILVTTPDRPLIRAGKGTLQRGACLAQYATEIDNLYKSVEEAPEEDDDAVVLSANSNPAVVSQRIRETIRTATNWPTLDDSTNFFERGMDSLQALQLMRALQRGLRRPDLGLSTVYRNPTISQLAAALAMAEADEQDDRDLMEPLLDTYRGLVHKIPAPSATPQQLASPVDVILTGSTGTLGSFILHSLIEREGVGHIFCLNRAEDGGQYVQTNRFARSEFAIDELKTRVTFLQADLAHPRLGLDDAAYETLRARAGLIIHNAWPVNFNLPLTAFRPQLAGVVNLFALAAATTAGPARVLFVSSVGGVAGQPADAGPAVESLIESFDAATASGYGRAKLLSEHLCDAASRHLGVPARVARVGQVAGPVGPGEWNAAEWLPSLVISSAHLGCLPDTLGPRFSEVDWVPADLLAEVMVDLAVAPAPGPAERTGAEFFNLRNPKTTTWDALLPAVKDIMRIHIHREPEVVSSSEWLERLQKKTENGSDDLATSVASTPALKLLDFYRDSLWVAGPQMPAMSIDRATSASPTLSNMSPIHPDLIQKWGDAWLWGRV